ncbi:hypothetical protein B0H10DRAFT_2229760 [Mycena sp. CBHHK59/15]|nr:hypothetical protein B0H10DRAFT_2229760 [Mycena sp. CBHHK59/15]
MLFLLALILNPWEQVSCFGHSANLDHFKITDLAVQMYHQLALRPGFNGNVNAEKMVGKAMSDYLAGIGCFQAWDTHRKIGDIMTIDEERDPITFWKGYLKTKARDPALMTITLFSVVVNQAALGLKKTEKTLKVNSQIHAEHCAAGLVKDPKVQQNHKAVEKLLQSTDELLEEEEMYMHVMAELDAEDDTLNAREIEIDDSEVYRD